MSKHAAPVTAVQLVRDRMHDVRVAVGEVEPHEPRHAKPVEAEAHIIPLLWDARKANA